MPMSQEQWEECTAMWLMAEPYIRFNSSPRKKRLFAAAVCRSVLHLITGDRSTILLSEGNRLGTFSGMMAPDDPDCLIVAIENAERCADGLLPVGALVESSEIADRLSFVTEYYYACREESWGPVDYKLIASSTVAGAIHRATQPDVNIEDVAKLAACAVNHVKGNDDDKPDGEEESRQCDLARDLFPNPECVYVGDLSWVTSEIEDLAQSIYDDNSFDRMTTLGVAIRNSKCSDDTVFTHCDSHDTHVRGCWVLDAILGKS